MKRLRAAVILGGRSVEHEVSIVSAKSFVGAMDKSKYEPVLIGIDGAGKWHLLGGDFDAVDERVHPDSGSALRLLSDMPLLPSSSGPAEKETEESAIGQIDVVVPMVHGSFGEDGCIQGLCELLNLPYVGAGVLGSALGMDKITTKRLFKAEGFPVAKFISVEKWEWLQQPKRLKSRIGARIGYPCFVKPSNSGSSVGITKVHEAKELESALDSAAEHDRRIIVEEAIDARELECSVLGNDEPVASVVGEIIPCNEFYDYDAKYIDESSELVIPAKISQQISHNIRNCAVRAFKLLDISGMARVDFLMDRSTKRVYLNELNTIPGFTSISMYPKLWEASGVPYSELIDKLIELAFERHKEKSMRRFDYGGSV
ncbi:MAG: D-alanine--D-alanine ligase [Candidatus Coatesbacteria bacterium]|nr:D-alanine--D-alanine ligase [Candidatus Coatesbacteria bacterium]